MKKINYAIPNVTFLAAVLIVTGAIMSGCGGKKTSGEETGVRSVHVAEAFTDSVVLHKTFPGYIKSAITTEVVARVSGKILTQNFTGGQYVNKGQVLFTIESTTYRNAVERAEASLSSALSQQDYYTKQLAAMKKAFEADAVSRMQVIQAENNLAQATASIRDARADLSNAKENLSYCTVTAPSSGYISDARTDPGNFVNGESGAVVLATIYDNDNLRAEFSVSDSQYEELIGKTGGLDSKLYRNVPLSFKEPLKNQYCTDLFYEAPSVDQSTGSLLIMGKLKNVNNELKNGMYVSVSLPYGVEAHAILVKDASLGSDQLGYYLYTVDDRNKVHKTTVDVGEIYRDSLRIINSGIEPGQKYVTKALLNVHSGETVKPIMTK